MSDSSEHRLKLGWREWVHLPAIGDEPIKAKIDTGARSSALHAFALERFERDGEAWVRFEFLPRQRSEDGRQTAELPIHDVRDVRSSSGEVQTRIVVRTAIRLGEHEWDVDLTLSDREQMGFRMLVGREAIRGRGLVDPGGSFLWGVPELVQEMSADAETNADAADDADESHATYDPDSDEST